MKNSFYLLLAGALCLTLGMGAVDKSAAAQKNEILSNAEVIKIVKQKVGSDVLSISLHASKGGHYYYEVTVDNTPDDEAKDVFVNARTGKVVQVIEHPSDMILGEDSEG